MPKHGSINLYVHENQKARQLRRTAQDVHLDSHTAPELCGAGIKREGHLYLEKYGTGGPEFGIKEEFVTERGRQLFHARAMIRTGRFVVYSSAN